MCVCLLASGCGKNPLLDWNERQIDEMQRLTALLDGIVSPADADAKLDDIRQCYANLTQMKREAPALFREHGSGKVLKSSLVSVQKRMQAADAALGRAALKLEPRKDLSEPFCSMLRKENMVFLLATMEAMEALRGIKEVPRLPTLGVPQTARQILDFYEDHGTARVVEIDIAGGDSHTAQSLIDIAEGASEGLTLRDGRAVMVGPILDFDAYCTVVEEIGVVSQIDRGRRAFRFSPNSSRPGPSIASRQGARSGSGPEPPADFNSAFDPGVSHEERVAAIRKRHAEFVRDAMADARARGFDVPDSALAGPGSPWADEPVEPGAPVAGSRPPARASVRASGPQPAAPAGAEPKLSSRDQRYHELAKQLAGDDRFAKRTAAEQLLEVRPAEIGNRDVRQMVARGYRGLLSDAHYMATDGENAVRGLERHAGKHSAPLLIEYIASGPVRVPDAAIEVLQKHRSPEGTAALVSLLELLGNRDKAADALRQIGPDAEAPLLTALPNLDPFATPLALELLGDVGSRQSVRPLRKWAKSPAPNARAAASEALRRVRERL